MQQRKYDHHHSQVPPPRYGPWASSTPGHHMQSHRNKRSLLTYNTVDRLQHYKQADTNRYCLLQCGFGNSCGCGRCRDARSWNRNTIQLFLPQIWCGVISWLEAKWQKTCVQRRRTRELYTLSEHVSWQEIRESLHEGWLPCCCGAAQAFVLWGIGDIRWQTAVNQSRSMLCNTNTGPGECFEVWVH